MGICPLPLITQEGFAIQYPSLLILEFLYYKLRDRVVPNVKVYLITTHSWKVLLLLLMCMAFSSYQRSAQVN